MVLVETHCHLDFEPLSLDVGRILARAADRGVSTVVVPSYDVASWSAIAGLASHEAVEPAFGLHPWKSDERLDLDRLAHVLADHRGVAVGEIGLDFKIDTPAPDRQIEVLERQLALARRLDLPVILHCRGAFDALFESLARFEGVRGVVHAYSRGPELARRICAEGLHLGFGGAITRPRARRARRSAELAPLENIVLETDAPSIGLDGVDPAAAEPHHVADVADALAGLRGMSIDAVAEATTANARRLFGI